MIPDNDPELDAELDAFITARHAGADTPPPADAPEGLVRTIRTLNQAGDSIRRDPADVARLGQALRRAHRRRRRQQQLDALRGWFIRPRTALALGAGVALVALLLALRLVLNGSGTEQLAGAASPTVAVVAPLATPTGVRVDVTSSATLRTEAAGEEGTPIPLPTSEATPPAGTAPVVLAQGLRQEDLFVVGGLGGGPVATATPAPPSFTLLAELPAAPAAAPLFRQRYRVYDQDSANDIAERLGFAGVTVLPTTGLPEGAPPPANVFEATEDSRSLTLGGASLWFYDTARTPTGEPVPNALDQALAFLTERELLEAPFTAVVEGGDGGNVFFFSQVAGLAVANQPAWWVGIGAGGVYLLNRPVWLTEAEPAGDLPLRSAETAWAQLQAGGFSDPGIPHLLTPGGAEVPVTSGNSREVTITDVELVYFSSAVTEPDGSFSGGTWLQPAWRFQGVTGNWERAVFYVQAGNL